VLIKRANAPGHTITRENFDAIWKAAVQNTHPDRGGNPDDFRAVMAARDLIRTEKGWV
jgi:hypothetical protein